MRLGRWREKLMAGRIARVSLSRWRFSHRPIIDESESVEELYAFEIVAFPAKMFFEGLGIPYDISVATAEWISTFSFRL